MTRLLLALPLLLAAGCATRSQPYAPVRDVAYQALGGSPYWTLAIGDDRIVFRTSVRSSGRSWPRVLPRTIGATRIWETGEGVNRLYIEATRAPCGREDGTQFEDNVTVRLQGGEVRGCGGRMIERGARR